jgi:hypothetical protein
MEFMAIWRRGWDFPPIHQQAQKPLSFCLWLLVLMYHLFGFATTAIGQVIGYDKPTMTCGLHSGARRGGEPKGD